MDAQCFQLVSDPHLIIIESSPHLVSCHRNWPKELESWTWPGADGRLVGVRVFARGCETAWLTLDGKTLGEEQFQANLTAVFVVPFAPSVNTQSSSCLRSTGMHLTGCLWLQGEVGGAVRQRLSGRCEYLRESDVGESPGGIETASAYYAIRSLHVHNPDCERRRLIDPPVHKQSVDIDMDGA